MVTYERTKGIIVGQLLALLLCESPDLARGEAGATKLMNTRSDTYRVDGYLEADTKYQVVPVPTPLDRGYASDRVIATLLTSRDGEVVDKLARLAVLYDLRETASGFLAVLRLGETNAEDFSRSVSCITALVWLGDNDQFAETQKCYTSLLQKADWEAMRPLLLRAAYAVGPRIPTEPLQSSVKASLDSLRNRVREARARNNATEADALERRQDRLEEFLNLEVPRLTQANSLRSSLEAQEEKARLPKLCSLYLADLPTATPPLSQWAAHKLVRVNPSLRSDLCREMLALASRYDKQDPARQKEFDLFRARALRAAVYFGAPIGEEAGRWLSKQTDPGTDVLALRPEWLYPKEKTEP